jgi:ribosomal protein RSM22 (predicted rRNA methylase)
MNVHENARLTPQGRLVLVERVTQQGWSLTQAAQAAGLSTSRAHH